MSTNRSSFHTLLEEGLPHLDKSNIDHLSSPHIRTTHHPATILLPANVSFPDEFATPYSNKGKESSLLLLGLAREGHDKCPFSSEADVQIFTMDALKDTIQLMGLSRDFGTKNEYTLFSYRPDIVVVIHETLGIIFVLEVKKPEKNSEESRAPHRKPRKASRAVKRVKYEAGVFDSELVAGQVFDHLQGMINLEKATPFAILTTFDQAVLVWTPPGKSDDIIKEELEKFETNEPEVPTPSSPKASGESKKNSSFDPHETPVQLKRQSDVEEDMEDEVPTFSESELPREVYYSPVYKGKNIIPLLTIAIRCRANAAAARTSRAVPSHGEKAGGECGMVHETGLQWKKLSVSTIWNYNKTQEGNRFFLWKYLGRGASGRALLACDSKGGACVLNFFLNDDTALRRRNVESERSTMRKVLLNESKAKTDAELSRWKEVCPEYKDHVRTIKLNNIWVLQMPYFWPIPPTERQSALDDITPVLAGFKKNGYTYKDADLCWRHVGRNADGKCYLFDLESLIKLNDAEDIDIEDGVHLLVLQRRDRRDLDCVNRS